jgi:hypothetical protein
LETIIKQRSSSYYHSKTTCLDRKREKKKKLSKALEFESNDPQRQVRVTIFENIK